MKKHFIILLFIAWLPLLGLLCYCPFAARQSIQSLSVHLHGSDFSARLHAPYFAVRTVDWFKHVLHLSIGYDTAIRWFYALPILIFLPSSLLLLLGVLSTARPYFIAAYVTLLCCLPLLILIWGTLHPSFPLRDAHISPNHALQRTAHGGRPISVSHVLSAMSRR